MKTTTSIALATLALTFAACDNNSQDGALDDSYYYGDAAVDGKADSTKTGRFETFTGADGKIYFHLLAANGEKVLASQGYASKKDAEEGIATVRFNGQQTDAYQLLQAKDGEWYFDLLAGNWQVIGTGELYVSKSNAQRGLETVASVVESATYGRASTEGARFQIFRGLDGQYYFHLRAGNGAIVLQSEGYTAKASAEKGQASVLTNGSSLKSFQIKDAADGQAYFVLVAGNNQVIGVSQTYSSRSAAQAAANAVSAILTALK
jgi:uncharacterized protein YegP (UPF0339 family)